MLQTLGITVRKFAPLFFIAVLMLSLLPLTPVSAEGETFAFSDAEKKEITMTGGVLETTNIESPDKIIFKSTDGVNFRADGTQVKMKTGECLAAAQVKLTGTKFEYTTLAHNTCPFMNNVTKAGTVSANAAQITCSTSGTLSWIICPLTDMAQNFTKLTAGIVEGLLYVEPLTLNTTAKNPIYVTWELLRNIANIAFIIVFLVVVFSQATSMGMSNYGIKRILPRLIIMAVLVNISYYLCAFAVDVANLLGAGVKGLIQYGIDAAPKPNLGGEQWDGTYAGFIVSLIVVIIAVGVASQLWPIIATMFAAITFAVLIGFVVLVARQVIITLLIIVSPLAFVAALLPNTESWFSRWRKLFTTMLISYPVIMFIFYGSALVATILGTTLTPPAN